LQTNGLAPGRRGDEETSAALLQPVLVGVDEIRDMSQTHVIFEADMIEGKLDKNDVFGCQMIRKIPSGEDSIPHLRNKFNEDQFASKRCSNFPTLTALEPGLLSGRFSPVRAGHVVFAQLSRRRANR
jgi:hypothetical protein